MKLTDVLERIRDQCPGFASVDHVLTSDADVARPAALVGVSRIAATPNGVLGGPHVQRLRTVVSVWIVGRRRQDTLTGYGAADEWQDLVAELRAALVAWSPGGTATPLDYAGGALEKHPAGFFAWREDFATEDFAVSP